ncbi:MAG: hypothetical protein ACRC29_13900 [Enterobacterales bacterium]
MTKTPLFKELTTPMLLIEDMEEITGEHRTAMRMKVSRGTVKLLSSDTQKYAGRGYKALYSVRDAMQFLLLAKLGRLHIPGKVIDTDCMAEIMNYIVPRFEELAAGYWYGNSPNPIIEEEQEDGTIKRINNERFVYIFEHNGELRCDEVWSQWADGTWVTIDVVDFSTKILKVYNRRKGTP